MQLEIKNRWREIWFSMSEGNVQKYNELKGLETLEFFDYYDSWKEKVEAQISEMKKLKNK